MGFWAFMTICIALLPLVILFFGLKFEKSAPRSINGLYGYRSARSMKNWDSWQYAHKKIGSLWKKSGLIMLPISVALMFVFIKSSADAISVFGAIIVGLQIAVMLITVFVVEKDLKKSFDENGKQTEASILKEQELESKKNQKAEKKSAKKNK